MRIENKFFITFLSVIAILAGSMSLSFAQVEPDPQPIAQEEPTVFDRLNEFEVISEDFSNAIFIEQVGNDNETTINQIGSDNTAAVAINGNLNGSNSNEILQENAFNDAAIIIDGDNNNFNVKQGGPLGVNVLKLGQVGDFNIATAEQSAVQLASNEANLTQIGTRNNITFEQYATVAGLGNEINLFQTGVDNDATFYQEGGNNQINSAQLGTNVDATFEQFGVDNSLSTLQAGNNLNLGITQYGGTSMTVIQTNFFTIGN
jgi:hypothetical protein